MGGDAGADRPAAKGWGERRLPGSRHVDGAPRHAVRGLHVVLRLTTEKDLRRVLVAARRARFNLVVLQLADGAALDALRRVARPDAFNIDQLKALADLARANGLQVVLEVTLLTHQARYFADPALGYFNRNTYDPRDSGTRAWVRRLLDEVVSVFAPAAIHIGHDEVDGWHSAQRRQMASRGEQPLPPELYLSDLQAVSNYLRDKGVAAWMWGDMLLSPEQFPGMESSVLHGRLPGYPQLLESLPPDLVVVDWHYFDSQANFPSSGHFSAAGHRVMGATWKNAATTAAFSRYLADRVERHSGMLATTWFHVQRREWDTVEDIIKTSGEAFWGE